MLTIPTVQTDWKFHILLRDARPRRLILEGHASPKVEAPEHVLTHGRSLDDVGGSRPPPSHVLEQLRDRILPSHGRAISATRAAAG